jgi:3-oxoacyl-[acyl-carrier-protein] synthase III
MSADGLIGMSVMAAADAMEQAHVRYGDIDAIFAGSSGTCRRRWPEYAVQVGYLMGSRNMPRETVSRGCGGGVAALVHAKRYIETHWNPGRDVTCLVFAGDRITDWLNPADYGTCALFSDGAAATVVTTKGNASDDGLGQYLIEAADATNIASGEFAMSLENNNDVKKIISAWTARLYTGLPCSGHFRLPHGC